MARPCYWLKVEAGERREIEKRFRLAKNVRQRERLEVLRMACRGSYTLAEMAQEVGRARSAIQRWLEQYKSGGLDGLLQLGKPGASKSPLQEPQLVEELREQLAAGNFRTARQVARWLKERHGIERTIWTVYYWLKNYGASLRVPRPAHLKKDSQAAAAFVLELEDKLKAVPRATDRPVRIWVQDEGRFGLHTIVRRCWALKGIRVVKPCQKKFQWAYLYAAMELGTGKTESLWMPHVGLEVSEAFLNHLAQSDPQAEHIVIWDGAGFHQKEGIHTLPERIHLIQLPPYSPELNPTEKLWDVLKDGLCNRIFNTLEQLWQALRQEIEPFYQPQRVHQLLGQSDTIACANASSN